jgi:hypothetical protein
MGTGSAESASPQGLSAGLAGGYMTTNVEDLAEFLLEAPRPIPHTASSACACWAAFLRRYSWMDR